MTINEIIKNTEEQIKKLQNDSLNHRKNKNYQLSYDCNKEITNYDFMKQRLLILKNAL